MSANTEETQFIHQFRPSTDPAASPTLLLLHGTGGDENDLLGLGRALDGGASLLSPRGKVLEGGMPRFFRRLAEGVFDLDDLTRRTHELADFVAEAAARYGFDPQRVVAVGFSNGANIAASLLLLRPGTLAAAALFRPMVPLVPATLPDLSRVPVFIGAGRQDPIVPTAETERLAALLRQANAPVTLHWEAGGHGLMQGDLSAAQEWLAGAPAPYPLPAREGEPVASATTYPNDPDAPAFAPLPFREGPGVGKSQRRNDMELGGIHHVTAVTGDTSRNVAFYTQVLGMRLVKKTVNQDDVSAYHLFYADGVGSPGTDMTFFDWPQAGPTRPGVGTTTRTAFRVPSRDALDAWAARLEDFSIPHSGITEWNGRATITFADLEGQPLALVDDGGAPYAGTPWAEGPVPTEMAIRGFDAVTLAVRTLAPTAHVLTDVLGFRQTGVYVAPDGSGDVHVFSTAAGGPGAEVHLVERPGIPYAQVGIGGVHHVAFRTPNEAEHAAWRERIAAAGLRVTPEIDRFYFHSIYFREPGGVLFEIATDGPGFATDEPVASLGASLALPPFLEGHRAAIEAGLHPITPIDLTPTHR